MDSTIYLDYNATTPCSRHVANAMRVYQTQHFSSSKPAHAMGRFIAEEVEKARGEISNRLGLSQGHFIFNSGASEGVNHALKGWTFPRLEQNPLQMIISEAEHRSVKQVARWLQRFGVDVITVPLDGKGLVAPEFLEKHLPHAKNTLVAVTHANNETGVIQPVEAIGRICRQYGAIFFCDAVQSLGKIPLNHAQMQADLLVVTAHKCYGPKGIGGLFVKQGVALENLVHGSSHERGARAGTPNVPGIIGFGAAVVESTTLLERERSRLGPVRDHLESTLRKDLPDVWVNGAETPRLPNTTNISFGGVVATDLLRELDQQGVIANTGVRHIGKNYMPSPLLKAMGLAPARSLGAVRFSLGRETTLEKVNIAALRIISTVRKLRRKRISP